jgi:hypothetical protein
MLWFGSLFISEDRVPEQTIAVALGALLNRLTVFLGETSRAIALLQAPTPDF